MWYPSTVTVAPSVEPITLEQAKAQCSIVAAETYFDALITRLIKAARAHVEDYCNARWAEQTVVAECDSFDDLRRLPHGPLKSVTEIAYTDPGGEEQSLAASVYILRKAGLEPSIVPKPEQSWPSIMYGSPIRLTAVFGGNVPESVQHAMLMLIAHWFANRDAVVSGTSATKLPIAVDALLCNHRRGV